MSHNLAIITTVYQNYTVLTDFIQSLEKQTDAEFELIVADLSKDRKKIHTKLPLTIIEGENRGYAHGINLGLKMAQEKGIDMYAVMNNDIYFQKDFIKTVKESVEQHPTSIIGAKIYYAKGYEFHKNRYKKTDLGNVLWYAGGQIDWSHALTTHFGVDEIDTHQYDSFLMTDFITGCFMAFDREVIARVGLWDESYFLYYEDADYCIRAKRHDINLYYDPSVILWHKNAQSTGGSGSELHQKFQVANRLKFGLKYAPLRTKLHLLKNSLFNQS